MAFGSHLQQCPVDLEPELWVPLSSLLLLLPKVLVLLCARTYAVSQCALIVLPIFVIIFIVCFSFLNKLISCSKVQIPEFTSSFILRGIWLYISKEKERNIYFY